MRKPFVPYNRVAIPRAVRKKILEQFDYKCAYCLSPATQVDHVIPVAKGGTNDEDNLVASCVPCNLKASGLGFKNFDRKRAWILDPHTRTPERYTRYRRRGPTPRLSGSGKSNYLAKPLK